MTTRESRTDGHTAMSDGPMTPEPGWHWRNCRSLGFSLHCWLWPWAFGVGRSEDMYGGERYLHLGPLGFNLHYSIGNCSSYGLDRFTGLSEAEAYDRALRYEAKP